MRSLVSDTIYYCFLDKERGHETASSLSATHLLMREFPNLKREEAKAVFQDWKTNRVESKIKSPVHVNVFTKSRF